jgi:predicted transcriptional regulator of viral defense system
MTTVDQVLKLAREKSVLSGSDLEERGIKRQYLQRLYERGMLRRVGRGLYSLPDVDATEHHTIVEAAKRVPHGTICLLSALRLHGLTTQNPYQVWLAIRSSSWRPKMLAIPLRLVHMSESALAVGVEERSLEGVNVRIFTPAKTVVDCFKFRNQIGVDVAIEALMDFRQMPEFDIDVLWHHAKACRVAKVMRPYLEATA